MRSHFKFISFLLGLALLPLAWFIHALHDDTVTVREHQFTDPDLPSLKIAVMGDFHFSEPEDLAILGTLKRQIIKTQPDIIFYVGDYTGRHTLFDTHTPEDIVNALEALAGARPTFAVLGNHDNGRLRSSWVDAFEGSNIKLLENKVSLLEVDNQTLCIVGHGDYFTGEWSSVWLPPQCNKNVLTLTHDPFGLLAESGEVQHIGFAGHTHCGQFVFPFGWTLYVPTEAPEEMHCGAFHNGAGGVVTGGLGYTIADLRFGDGAELSWDLVRIN